MCGQHNVRASAEDNTGQNADKGHTPNPKTEIKIPDPRESNPDRRVRRQGLYRPRHGEFGNSLPQLGHNTAQIVVLKQKG